MRTTAIRRTVKVLVTMGLVTGVALGSAPASASGGGGCGRQVSDQRGTTISIKSFCFGPTILRVPLRRAVTWVNNDPFSHTVLGANAVWGGFDQLKAGARVTYRFVRPGVYPYVCTFHPGMVGVVIAGSANGPGAAQATVTKEGPVKLVERSAAAALAAAPGLPPAPATGPALVLAPVGGPSPVGSWAVGALLAIVVTAAAVWSKRGTRAAAR